MRFNLAIGVTTDPFSILKNIVIHCVPLGFVLCLKKFVMKIIKVNIIPIYPRLAPWYQRRKVDLHGIDASTVFNIRTDKGITAYGDKRVLPWGQPAADKYDHLIGKDVFDFINNNQPFDSCRTVIPVTVNRMSPVLPRPEKKRVP